jgi:hypothetical protein
MGHETRQKLPEVQYALFCREVIENDERTFRDVLHNIGVGRPKKVEATLVIRLLNVAAGLHKITINCLIPPTQLLKWDIDIELKQRKPCLITQPLIIPILQSNTLIFTILFDGTPVKRLWLPVEVLQEKLSKFPS